MKTQRSISHRTGAVAAVGTALIAAGMAHPATASAEGPQFVIPAGQACSGFDLGYDASGEPGLPKEFTDANGNPVRTIQAGTGQALTFTNMSTQKTFALRSNGATLQTKYNADGSSVATATGHNIMILFPTDKPAGPSTRLVVGRYVYTVDKNGVWDVQSVSGRVTDICAALGE